MITSVITLDIPVARKKASELMHRLGCNDGGLHAAEMGQHWNIVTKVPAMHQSTQMDPTTLVASINGRTTSNTRR